jgi:hypothetical protein
MFNHMIGYTMESMTITANGIINELQSFADPQPCKLDDVTAPITIWHGDADHLASVEDLQTYLGDKVTQTRNFKDCGSLLLLEYWPQVLDQLKEVPPT